MKLYRLEVNNQRVVRVPVEDNAYIPAGTCLCWKRNPNDPVPEYGRDWDEYAYGEYTEEKTISTMSKKSAFCFTIHLQLLNSKRDAYALSRYAYHPRAYALLSAGEEEQRSAYRNYELKNKAAAFRAIFCFEYVASLLREALLKQCLQEQGDTMNKNIMIPLDATYQTYECRLASMSFAPMCKVTEALPNTVVCRQRTFYLVTYEGLRNITEQEAQYYTLLNLVRLYQYKAFCGARLDEQALAQAQAFLEARQLRDALVALRKVWLSL